MILDRRFFALPIHKGTAIAYYETHTKYVKKEKEKLETSYQWGRPWEEIPKDVRVAKEDYWKCPPWFFNEVVGFLDIGMDRGHCMTADIYLKNKYFPNDRKGSGYRTTLQNQQVYYYAEVPKRHILDLSKNELFVAELQAVITDAQNILDQINARSKYKVWRFPFSWDHINFVKALPEVRTKEYLL